MTVRALRTAAAAVNLAAKFALEVAAIVAFALWGATVGSGRVSVAVAVAAPLFAVAMWGVLAAPRADHRLPLAARAPFELSVFTLAALAFSASAGSLAAIVFAVAAIVNAVLLTAFEQWEH